MAVPFEDTSGPTQQRLHKAGEFLNIVGRGRSNRRITMLDSALGRAWVRQKIKPAEYSALLRYAHCWAAGGLEGTVRSVDLNRIQAVEIGSAMSEGMLDYRAAYHAARESIGIRPAMVADSIACYDIPVAQVGLSLGYQSLARGRVAAYRILGDAGYRLGQFWRDHDRH